MIKKLPLKLQLPIPLPINDVVQQIDRARHETKAQENDNRHYYLFGVRDRTGKEERRKHKQVLQPVIGAHRLPDVEDHLMVPWLDGWIDSVCG